MRQLLLVAMIALLPLPAAADDTSSPSNVASIAYDQRHEETIRKLYGDFESAWNRHDTEAMAMSWSIDGDHVEPDGTIAKGRDTVLELFTKQHETIFKDTELDLKIVDVWFITANVTLVDGTYILKGARLPDGTEIPAREGRLTAILMKERGSWSIAASRLMIPTVLPYKKKG